MLRQKDLSLQAHQQHQHQQQQAQHQQHLYPSHHHASPLVTHNLPSLPMPHSPLSSKTPTNAQGPPFPSLDYHPSPGYAPIHHLEASSISTQSYFLHDHDHLRHPSTSSASASSIGANGSLSHSHNSQPSPPTAGTNSPGRDADLLRDLFWPSWPARLPTPELLQHLYVMFSPPHTVTDLSPVSTSFLLPCPMPTAFFTRTRSLPPLPCPPHRPVSLKPPSCMPFAPWLVSSPRLWFRLPCPI